MSTLAWSELRARASAYFDGELPTPATEETIVSAFEAHPLVVTRALERVAESFKAGRVRSGWAVWRKEAERADALRDVEVEVGDRELLVRQAEAWIRNAGLHFDAEREVEDAIFGEVGGFGGKGQSLHAYRDDELLRERLLGLWRSVRPTGAKVERAAVSRLREWREARARAAEIEQAVPLAPRPERASAGESYFEQSQEEEA